MKREMYIFYIYINDKKTLRGRAVVARWAPGSISKLLH